MARHKVAFVSQVPELAVLFKELNDTFKSIEERHEFLEKQMKRLVEDTWKTKERIWDKIEKTCGDLGLLHSAHTHDTHALHYSEDLDMLVSVSKSDLEESKEMKLDLASILSKLIPKP